MMKKKKFNNIKIAEQIRRENELQKYGKLLSLRPSVVHKDKKKYTRKQKHKENEDENKDTI